MLIWLLIMILMIAVLILIVLQFRKQPQVLHTEQQQMLENQIMLLENNLKKTLEIMQDLAKGVQTDRELLNQTVQKSKLLELQNAELIALLSKYVDHTEMLKKFNDTDQA